MITQTKIVDQILLDVANIIYNNYSYLGIGTGTTPLHDGSTILSAGVTFTVYNVNELRDAESYINGYEMVMLWTIEPGEPTVQPVDIGEIGLYQGVDKAGTLGAGAVLNTPLTKDNSVRQRWRATIRVMRSDGT